jgi:hypothetical protein
MSGYLPTVDMDGTMQPRPGNLPWPLSYSATRFTTMEFIAKWQGLGSNMVRKTYRFQYGHSRFLRMEFNIMLLREWWV